MTSDFDKLIVLLNVNGLKIVSIWECIVKNDSKIDAELRWACTQHAWLHKSSSYLVILERIHENSEAEAPKESIKTVLECNFEMSDKCGSTINCVKKIKQSSELLDRLVCKK